ncbi:hypothetical protein Palpr_0311 [Paludibacter propionicigenes WB4]|uniref:Uncharacterized protein n=1 Tax=Paludibacter propionicigenes (strain DSM 17365 / JCM 13257 / WB4) TaxID=694427 RepID=E4T192_PALPW|nr:hypothetical protein Palpr_0311 [Paludibacter propionicigenes WB4]
MTEAMGIWRFAKAFAVVERQSELKISEANAGLPVASRSKTAGMHVSQPMNKSVCYVVVCLYSIPFI